MAAVMATGGFLLGTPGRVAAAPTVAGTYEWPLADPTHVAALNAAYSMIGTPYRYGGTTPAGFDCSGFTQWSFAQAGYSLPRDSRSQQAWAFPVASGDLRPGDLVFWGSPVYHVAIYVGDGQIIHSPSSGKTVNVTLMRYLGTPSSYGRVK